MVFQCKTRLFLASVESTALCVGRYLAPPAKYCPELLQKLVAWLDSDDFCTDEVFGLAKPILGAVIAHLYVAWIHPYGDGYGRTARLLEMFILVSAGVPSPAAHLFSNHYNKTRSEYYRQLDAASKSRDIVPFIEYALQGFVDGLQEQIAIVQTDQLDISWRNFVHERFRDKGEVGKRQRELCLELGRLKQSVPVAALRHLNPKIAKEYQSKSEKTIQRDVARLLEMRLIVPDDEGNLRANIGLMQGFLPRTNLSSLKRVLRADEKALGKTTTNSTQHPQPPNR
jgi:Fic family protein